MDRQEIEEYKRQYRTAFGNANPMTMSDLIGFIIADKLSSINDNLEILNDSINDQRNNKEEVVENLEMIVEAINKINLSHL